MKYYAGLDVSMKTTFICIVSQEKKVVFEQEVLTDPDEIYSSIRSTKLVIENSAVESGSISRWLVQEISKRGLSIVCVDARKMSKVLSININKTDKNDARLIAEALRCDFYSKIEQKPQKYVEEKILIGARQTLKHSSTQLKNTIRGHLKAFGIRLGSVTDLKFEGFVMKAIKDKAEIVVMSLKALLDTFKEINKQVDVLEKQLKNMAKEDEDIQLLTTIPGIGLITAHTFKVHLGDPKRFKTSRSVGAYFGMTPTQYSSGESHKQGRVSKCGSPVVRSLLNEAAFSILYSAKSWSRIKAWGQKIRKKKGHKKATMAIGRKLSTIMHRMLITRKPFEYGTPKEKEVKVMQ
jgi:transposase